MTDVVAMTVKERKPSGFCALRKLLSFSCSDSVEVLADIRLGSPQTKHSVQCEKRICTQIIQIKYDW